MSEKEQRKFINHGILSSEAVGRCTDIFHDFTYEEVLVFPRSIIMAWETGRKLVKLYD